MPRTEASFIEPMECLPVSKLPETRLPLVERRTLLKSLVVVKDERVRTCEYVEAAPNDLLPAVREQGLNESSGSKRRTNRLGRALRTTEILCHYL